MSAYQKFFSDQKKYKATWTGDLQDIQEYTCTTHGLHFFFSLTDVESDIFFDLM